MTNADETIATALEQFPQKNLDRLVAHLAAGLPMMFETGWDWSTGEPATCGCIMGVAFTIREASAIGIQHQSWPYEGFASFLAEHGGSRGLLSAEATAAIGRLVNAEMERRATTATTLPAESRHDTIIPSLEAVPA